MNEETGLTFKSNSDRSRKEFEQKAIPDKKVDLKSLKILLYLRIQRMLNLILLAVYLFLR